MSLHDFLRSVAGALRRQDSVAVARQVGSAHTQVALRKVQIPSVSHLEVICGDALPSPFDAMVMHVLLCTEAFRTSKCVDAYGHLAQALNAFLQDFKLSTNWSISILHTLARDLRLYAFAADGELESSGKKVEKVEDAGRLLMNCFALCNSDRAPSLEESKKLGTLPIVNELLRLYFQNNQLHMCKPLIRSTESMNAVVPFDSLPISQRVCYSFFTGRLAVLDDEYNKALELLTFAFENCQKKAKANRRRILVHLIPVKLLAGSLPSAALLEANNLTAEFSQLSEAVRNGSLVLLRQSLIDHESFFINEGIFLVVERLKNVIYRNLFKKVAAAHAPETRFPLRYFEVALHCMDTEWEVNSAEVECILAILIAGGFIKGYISHQHSKVVLSKGVAFPPLSQLVK